MIQYMTNDSRAFDRTYEGLKPVWRWLHATGIGPSFDRTYEGLKRQPPHRVAAPGAHLLTVPMRV